MNVLKITGLLLCLSAQSFASVLQNEFTTDASNRSAMLFYKQDPNVKTLGVRSIVFPTKIERGPRNYYVAVKQDKSSPNEGGDFFHAEGTPEFDAVHTFAVVWDTMLMYRKDLEHFAALYPNNPVYTNAIKTWDVRDYSQLKIYPKSMPDQENAYYARFLDENDKPVRELRFFSFDGDKGRVHTCRSLDIVAHETGHAILDIWHPEYFDTSSSMVGGFHESFGDMTAIFAALSQYDLCEALYTETKGDLGKQSFLTELAEEFGVGIGQATGLRNLLDEVTITSVDNEVHALSRVFTNAVYGVLRDAHKEADLSLGHMIGGAELINQTGRYLRHIVLQTVLEMNKPSPSFSDFAHKMYEIALNQPKTESPYNRLQWASYIESNFNKRGIPTEADSTTLDWVNQGENAGLKIHLCGTSARKCK